MMYYILAIIYTVCELRAEHSIIVDNHSLSMKLSILALVIRTNTSVGRVKIHLAREQLIDCLVLFESVASAPSVNCPMSYVFGTF